MAEKPKQAGKRQVKNPETFRERAIKAAASDGKVAKTARLRQAGQPVKQAASKVFNRQPFRLLAKPLRLIGRILVPRYVRHSWVELRQVEWPKWRQSLRLTGAVLIFAIIFGLIVAGVDYGLDKFFRNVILK